MLLKSFAEIFRRQKTFPFEIKHIRNKSDTDRVFLQQDLESRRSGPYLPLTSSSAMLIVLSIYGYCKSACETDLIGSLYG